MIHLGVNLDHIATLRNARGGIEPDPLVGAELAILGGADSITVHLREDRRHINERDVELIKEKIQAPLNLEMSLDAEIVEIAKKIRPHQATLVPERREEMTTESGLDVVKFQKRIGEIQEEFRPLGIQVSLFVDPDIPQLEACAKLHIPCVELHTGAFANSWPKAERESEKLQEAAVFCNEHNIRLHAGHGLNYQNTYAITGLPELKELNIGHSIISRAVFHGLEKAVRDMKKIVCSIETIDK